mmetsp:Transcript_13705/g.24163  ORF Transcript_13705/g.24163 Transcript_13705/m.24163 type:complete len:201 (-) Transcript_13705:102-704(-)
MPDLSLLSSSRNVVRTCRPTTTASRATPAVNKADVAELIRLLGDKPEKLPTAGLSTSVASRTARKNCMRLVSSGQLGRFRCIKSRKREPSGGSTWPGPAHGVPSSQAQPCGCTGEGLMATSCAGGGGSDRGTPRTGLSNDSCSGSSSDAESSSASSSSASSDPASPQPSKTSSHFCRAQAISSPETSSSSSGSSSLRSAQ